MGSCLSAVLQELAENANEQKENEQKENQYQSQPSASGASSSLSPIYPSLPSGAEKHIVRNTYDGDTFTLINEDRVRLLGIDTPEIKEKQPFAQEAKAYTKDRCDKQDVWLSYEPGGDKKDHYGRLLAFVWVKDGNGYLCVNEGIIAAGFATAYRPNSSSKLHNWNKLIALQKQAKEQKRGMWHSFQDRTVVKTANGAAYHIRSCEHLSNVRHLTEMKSSEAMDLGLHPCRTCLS